MTPAALPLAVYFAGVTEDRIPLLRAEGATHVLVSYADLRRRPDILRLLDGFKVFLDCGAWSVASGVSAPIDVADHIAWVKAAGFPFELVAALDVIGDAAASERNYQATLDAGLVDAMPTWHAGEPPELAAHYAATAHHLAIGGLAARARGGNVGRFIVPAWSHVQHRRVHLFGVGAGDVIARYRPASVDNSTWLVGNQYGAVFTLTKFPILDQVVVRPSAGRFQWRKSLAIVDEMRRLGASWRELSTDNSDGRMRYNIRLMLEYMRRIDATKRTAP